MFGDPMNPANPMNALNPLSPWYSVYHMDDDAPATYSEVRVEQRHDVPTDQHDGGMDCLALVLALMVGVVLLMVGLSLGRR